MKFPGTIRFSLKRLNAQKRAARYYSRNKLKCFAANYRQRKKECLLLKDNYVKKAIIAAVKSRGIDIFYGDITHEMIESKRVQLAAERCLAKLKIITSEP